MSIVKLFYTGYSYIMNIVNFIWMGGPKFCQLAVIML